MNYEVFPPCLHLFFCAGRTAKTPQLPKFLNPRGSCGKSFFKNKKWSPKMKLFKLLSLLAVAFLFSCSNPTDTNPNLSTTNEDSPQALVIDALKQFQDLHDWIISGKPLGKRNALLKIEQTTADSIWIYGDTLTGGIGVVVTEKHSYPKGLLLITKNYKYGIGSIGGQDYPRIASITEKFISWDQYNSNTPETKVETELYAEDDNIVTHIKRYNKNGFVTRETYTFKEPIVTIDRGLKVVRKGNGTTGEILTLTYDANSGKLLTARSYGNASGDYDDGAFFTKLTEYDPNQPPLRVLRETKVVTLGKPNGEIWKIIERLE